MALCHSDVPCIRTIDLPKTSANADGHRVKLTSAPMLLLTGQKSLL
jgi:hypothetical protein